MIPPSTQRLPDPLRHAAFYAGVPTRRALAWLIDATIAGLLTAATVPFTVFVTLFFLPAVFLAISFVYRWLTLAAGSATLGMRILGLRLLDHQGHGLSGPTAFVHTLLYSICLGMVVPHLVSVGLMATGPRGQGLPDLVLGTVMINRPAV